MNCYRCNATLDLNKNLCTKCGADIRTFKKIVYMSNRYYNEGLMKAQVRDLSGARESLRVSLHLYKRNIQARNLLGLVLNAMGESAEALKEWVISKNMTTGPNIADRFINNMRRNMKELDSEVHGIKKYNQALQYAQNGAKDLATIQLKKVVQVHSNMVKAYELLALIYIDDGKYDQARKVLQRCLEVDRGNVSALYYMKELNSMSERKTRNVGTVGEDDREQLIIPVRFRDFGSYLANAIYILLGAAIGIAIAWFVIVPGLVKKNSAGLDEERLSYEAVISDLQGSISAMEMSSENVSVSESESESEAESISESELESESESESEAEKPFVAVEPIEREQQWSANQALVENAQGMVSADPLDYNNLYRTVMRINPAIISSANQPVYRELVKIITDLGWYRRLLGQAEDYYKAQDYENAALSYDTAYLTMPTEAENLYLAARSYEEIEETEEAARRYLGVYYLYPGYSERRDARARYLSLTGETRLPALSAVTDRDALLYVKTEEDYIAEMENGEVPVVPTESKEESPPEGEETPAEEDGQGESPAEGEVPAEGETPAEGEAPAEGETPAEGEAPAEGETPEEGETPAEGEAPAEGETPAEGEAPAEG